MSPQKIILNLVVCYISTYTYSQSSLNEIIKIEGGTLTIQSYTETEIQKVDVSDFMISKDLIANPSKLGLYYSPIDFRIILLKTGMAKIVDSSKIKPSEFDAQNQARDNMIGVWKQNPERKNEATGISEFLWNVFSLLNNWTVIAFVLGFFGFVFFRDFFKALYRTIFIERKIRLLLAGDTAAGKTALKATLLNPIISKEEITRLRTSSKEERGKVEKTIIAGRYEIFPELIDTPGSQPETVFNTLFGKQKCILVFVVAPVKHYGQEQDLIKWDTRFLDMQLGMIKIYMGAVASNMLKNKPLSIILFINKFDLLSARHPEDSNSAAIKNDLLNYFKGHIEIVTVNSNKRSIPCEIIIGSTIEKWNTNNLLQKISNSVYNKNYE